MMDYGRTFHAHHRMTADPVIGTTQLVALLQERIGRNADLAGKIAARGAEDGLPKNFNANGPMGAFSATRSPAAPSATAATRAAVRVANI